MTAAAKWAICVLLFLLVYVAANRLLAAAFGLRPARGGYGFRRFAGGVGSGLRLRAGRAGLGSVWRVGKNGFGLWRQTGGSGFGFRRRAFKAGTGFPHRAGGAEVEVRPRVDGFGPGVRLPASGTGFAPGSRMRKGSGFARPFFRLPFKPAGRASLAVLLLAAEAGLSPAGFALLSAIAGCAGFAGGALLTGSAKGTLMAGGLMFLLPSLWLRSRLASRQMKRRRDLLPAIESFYQGYVLSPGRNIRVAIRYAVESGRLPRHAQSVFERLHAELAVNRDPAESLRLFAASFASRWADLFTALIDSALGDGTDIAEGLRELISDMRRARRNDQAERNRLLEIRMANFSPLLFLAVFLAVNFRMDPDMAYRHYIQSDAGREMLLDACALIALSFATGIYLSLRKE